MTEESHKHKQMEKYFTVQCRVFMSRGKKKRHRHKLTASQGSTWEGRRLFKGIANTEAF